MANEKTKNKDSVARTFIVVFVLCLVCSIVVAGSAVGLKSTQQNQIMLDKQRNILDVAGLLTPSMPADEIDAVYKKFIRAKMVDLKTGQMSDSTGKYDLNDELRSDESSIALSPEEDLAKIRRRANSAEIYLVQNEQGETSKIVLPVYGSGLWSVMYAFIAIDVDGITSEGITYYQHGETLVGWAVRWITRNGVNSGLVKSCLMKKVCRLSKSSAAAPLTARTALMVYPVRH